jgi:hypothetical protein
MANVLTLENLVIRSTLLKHGGGSKFYESFMLCSPIHNEAVIINRWGAMKFFEAGGRIKCMVRGSVDYMLRDDRLRVAYLTKLKRGYEIESHIVSSDGQWNNDKKVMFLRSRQLDVGDVSSLSPDQGESHLWGFLNACGIQNAYDYAQFINHAGVGPGDNVSLTSTPTPKIERVRSKTWGSW